MSAVRVVVPTWNVRDNLRACLQSVQSERATTLEVVCVDDGGSDGSDAMVRAEFPQVRLLRQESNTGYASACNRGLEGPLPAYVLFLNADAELQPGALATLRDFLEASPGHGAAAPKLLDPDGSTQRACMAFPRVRSVLWFGTPLERWFPRSAELERYFLREFDHEHERDVEQPPAACLLVRGEALETMRREDGAVFDERLSLYFNDVDLSKRLARRGRPTRYLPAARVVHHHGRSTRQRTDRLLRWHLDRLAYMRKHHGRAAGLLCKACTTWSFLDFACAQALRGPAREPVLPLLRDLRSLLLA